MEKLATDLRPGDWIKLVDENRYVEKVVVEYEGNSVVVLVTLTDGFLGTGPFMFGGYKMVEVL